MQTKNKNFTKNTSNSSKNDKKSNNTPKIMKSFIIIDKQYDFDNPNGALYVPGGENINKPIIDYIKKNRNNINQIIWTIDSHKKKDQSFKDYGGQWPAHCVNGTDGATINKELYNELLKFKIINR